MLDMFGDGSSSLSNPKLSGLIGVSGIIGSGINGPLSKDGILIGSDLNGSLSKNEVFIGSGLTISGGVYGF